MPVYVGIAGKDSLAGGPAAAQTARTYLPTATVRTWPETTHSFPLQVPKELDLRWQPMSNAPARDLRRRQPTCPTRRRNTFDDRT